MTYVVYVGLLAATARSAFNMVLLTEPVSRRNTFVRVKCTAPSTLLVVCLLYSLLLSDEDKDWLSDWHLMLYTPLSVSVFAAVMKLVLTATLLLVVRRRWNLGKCKCEPDDWWRAADDRRGTRHAVCDEAACDEAAGVSVSSVMDCSTASVTGLSACSVSAASVVDIAGDAVICSGDTVSVANL